MMGKRWHFKRRKYMAKTGLMYSENFAKYDAGGGYLCLSARSVPWISTTDYYDTGERVTEAYNLLKKRVYWKN